MWLLAFTSISISIFCLLQPQIAGANGKDDGTVPEDVYWRSYDGKVPQDALIGLQDENDKLYIGNVHVRGEGIMIGHLRNGSKKIVVSGWADCIARATIQVKTKYVQILCTRHPDNFLWVNKTSLSDEKIAKMRVVGGHEHPQEYPLYIGRGEYEGEKIISKIAGDLMWFPWGAKEKFLKDFEVLIFDPSRHLIDVRISRK